MSWKTLILPALAGLFLAGCSGNAPAPEPAAEVAALVESIATVAAPAVTDLAQETIDGAAAITPAAPAAMPTAVPAPTTPPGSAEATAAPVAAAGSGGGGDFVPGTRPANSGNGTATDGGTLRLLFADPPTLDPHLAEDNRSGLLVNEVFGGLVTIEPFRFSVAPDLAERWEISPDGTTYTFYLRPEAKFHDGKEVTAQDVKWSLERVADPDTLSPVVDQYLSDIVGVSGKLSGAASEVSGVRVIDARTVALTIDAPKAYFLSKLTYPTGFVLDQANVGIGDDWIREPNGTGPFRLAEYVVGETLRLARNEYYHLGPPHLDEVEMILSGGSAMILYENDEIDVTGVGLADLERVLDPASPLNPQVKPYPARFSVSYIGLNVDQPPLDDAKFRRALNLAIDRDSIAAVAYEGAVRPAQTILPPGFPGYNADLNPYPYDPEQARQLLAESKYGGDLGNLPRLTLSITGSFGAAVPLGLEVILNSWHEELGLQVEIQQTEWATFLQDVNQKRFQMFSIAWGADYPDPQNFLEILFHSASEGNNTSYSNPQVDALLDQAGVERDTATRLQMYQDIERMILDDAPWVLLWNDEDWYFLVKPHIHDYLLLPMTLPKFRYIWMEQG